MKYFRMSYEEVVFKRSYLNIILLNAAIPGTKPIKKKGKESIDDDNEVNDEDGINASNYFLNMM